MARQKRTRAPGISPDLTAEKAAIIKGMLARGDRQSDIAAYFQMNPGRVKDACAKFPRGEASTELPPPGPYIAVPAADAEAIAKYRRSAATQRWRQRNPEKVKAQAKRRYAEAKSERQAYAAAYRNSPDYLVKREKRLRNSFASRLVHSAKKRAAFRGVEFSVTTAWVQKKLDAGKCEVTGLAFDFGKPKGSRMNARAPSLDRIRPGGGYTEANCQVVCLQYNLAKSEWGPAMLAEMARAVTAARLGA